MKTAAMRILLYANIIVIAMMLATGFAGLLNPETFTHLHLIGFAFPAFLLANVAFIVIWLFFDWKKVCVPALGFLLAYSPVMTYFPVNAYKEVPADAIKVMSFNVFAFNNEGITEGEPNPILEYITQSGADIVCIQEFTDIRGQDSLWHEMNRIYQHNDTVRGNSAGSGSVALYSKFPIKAKEKLPIKSANNLAGVFTIDIDGRDVKVINAHLETVGFSMEDKNKFSQMVHGDTDRGEIKKDSKTLLSKLAESAVKRASQARTIDEYVKANSNTPVIFCGDINDHPLSYVHNTIAENLKDCYRETGHWAGYSMHYYSMHVRIDNIMCSDHWNIYDCIVDRSVTQSDHYPIFSHIKLKDTDR
ncbi:MAG: endonuclease/exonuclease/phosphatase family protein [Bacteroidales bacterium]|nr:endonuclease/exonuclease/phosphatase family protein [Bacteroidales bacterium]MCM1146260.1 endonuclease/exonuclease/phosphatase family protein [Bacteroidales bacterium]MCM1205302.1 endonuclease/exonuclease/phosphatase family protein [Bacillota bacterium]MCM1509611.1 endonuclease/exonuclease/phosphatase family protein [Clostridium sp.]